MLPKGGGKPDSVITRAAGSVEYKENRTIDINDIHIGTCERYNVIGKGRYYSSYDDADKAIIAAAGNYGNVYDGENNIIWKRFKTSSYMIKGFSLRHHMAIHMRQLHMLLKALWEAIRILQG